RASRSQGERGPRVVIEIKQSIGKLVQRKPNVPKPIGQPFKDIIQFAPASDSVRRHELIIRPTNLLVELDLRSAAQTASLRVLVKNTANEKRVIANMRP